MEIVMILLSIILGIVTILSIVICLPVFFELQVERSDKLIGVFDIVFLYGILRITGSFLDQGVNLNIKVFNHEIKDDKTKENKQKKESIKQTKKISPKKNKVVKKVNKSIIEKFKYFRRLAQSKGMIKCSVKFLRRMIKAIAITKLTCDCKVSIENPELYGYACAITGAIHPIAGDDFNIEMLYEKYDFHGNATLKVKVSSRKILVSAILFIISKPVRKMIVNLMIRKDEAYGIECI